MRVGGGFHVIADNVPPPRHLQLLAIPEDHSLWAEWLDPAVGLRHQAVWAPKH